MFDVNTGQEPQKTEPEFSSPCEAAEALYDHLDSTDLGSPLAQGLQRQNLEDFSRAINMVNSLKSFELTPEDKQLFQQLSGALRLPDNISSLRDVREKLQSADNQLTKDLADLKKHFPTNGMVNEDVYRAIDLENRLQGLWAANELARAAEVALGRNGLALKDAATGMYAALTSGVSQAPGGLGPEFAGRLNELAQAVDTFKPDSTGVLNKEEARLLDDVRFALCGVSNPKAGTGIEETRKACEALERAAATNNALEGAGKIATAVNNLLTEFERLRQAAESRLTLADNVRNEQISQMISYVKQNHVEGPNWQCARKVAEYINAVIGGDFDLHIPSGLARDFGTVLKDQAHFYEVANNSPPKPGDVAVIEGWEGVPPGHAAIWIGNQWASEFLQSEFLQGRFSWFDPNLPYVSATHSNYQVFRWPDPRVKFNTLDIRNQSPQEAITRLAEFLHYCSHDPVAVKASFNRIKNQVGAENVRPP